MRIRREVLGSDHVDDAIARTTDFTADFQELITRYAWGEIWARPGLDRRTLATRPGGLLGTSCTRAHGEFPDGSGALNRVSKLSKTRHELRGLRWGDIDFTTG